MNFCAQCGNDLRNAAPVQPSGTQNTAPLQREDAVPAWAKAASVAPKTAPEEHSEEQQKTEYPKDAQDSISEGAIEDYEEAIPEPTEAPFAGEEPAAEGPLPDFGNKTEETGAADDLPQNQKKSKWKLPAILCVIALIAAGVFLWLRSAGGSKADISRIADSVLYLEVFDEDDAIIGTASGFLVDDQSTLVTNYHVVQDAYHIVAWTADGTQSTDVSSILAYDEVADLAVLHCDSRAAVEPLTVGDSEAVRQGDKVYAVGYPLGLANTLSDGIVSSRYLDGYDVDIIQVTAAISHGNSGGPLLDTNGRVIGVMCASYIYGQNLNVAIASHTLEDLLASGFHKISLKDWDDRPVIPGYESEDEEQEPEDIGEDVPDVVEETPGESDAAPETEQPEPEQPKPEQPKPEPPKTGQGTQGSKPAAPTAPVTGDTGINEPPANSGSVDPNAPSYGTSTDLPDTAVPLTAEAVTGTWNSNDGDYQYFLQFSGSRFQIRHYNHMDEEFYEEIFFHGNLQFVDDGTFYIDGPNIVVTYRTWSVWGGTISGWKTETWPVAYIHPGGIRFQNGLLGYTSYNLYTRNYLPFTTLPSE